MVSLAENEFCINCGASVNRTTSQSDCNHAFKKPIEFFIPSIEIYGKENIEWVLYTVDDPFQTVYIDSPDFIGPRQKVGTGGIALRNLRLVFENYLLNDIKLFSVIKEKLQLNDKQVKEVIRVLSFLEELYRNAGIFALSDFEFKKDRYPSLKLKDSPFFEFADLTGSIKFSEILNLIYVHGQWGSMNLIA